MLQPKLLVKHLFYRINKWNFSQHQQLLSLARQRTVASAIIACIAFAAIGVRLADVMVFRNVCSGGVCSVQQCSLRKNIVDRNGVILATQLVTASVYANPKLIIDVEEAAKKLHEVFPNVAYKTLLHKLKSEKSFVWIERHVSPKVQNTVHCMGIPGVYLQQDQKRVYPQGATVSHVIGKCDVDGFGVSGVEQYFDAFLRSDDNDLKLSLDIRVQHILRSELCAAIKKFSAIAANGIIMDARTGEIVAMVSLPDYDLNRPLKDADAAFNRNTLGVYEQGSTFKVLNAAIALETGVATPSSIFDATNPVNIGHFKITDFKGKNRPLSLTEAVVYSSNIAAIKIAQKFGPKVQKKFMEKFGILTPLTLEVPELGNSLTPKEWRETSMMTIAYGYGIATTPLHSLTAIAAVANDGYRPLPTFKLVPSNLRQARIDSFKNYQCVSKKTSQMIRQIMCLVLSEGMPIKANIECYKVFGKTGTAYKSAGKRGYGAEGSRSRTTSFIGGFPANNPQYVMIVMLDDPKATSETHGYATAGWNAKPLACSIIERIAPLLNIRPDFEENDFSLESMQQFTSFVPSDENDQ